MNVEQIIGTPTSYVPTVDGPHVLTVVRLAELANLPPVEAEKLLDALVSGYPSEGQGPIVRVELENGFPTVIREFQGMTELEYERWLKLKGNR